HRIPRALPWALLSGPFGAKTAGVAAPLNPQGNALGLVVRPLRGLNRSHMTSLALVQMTNDSSPVGLLAGAGRFPVLFAAKARQLGVPVVCAGIRDLAPPELAGLVDRFEWVGLARLGAMIRCFKRGGCRRAVMAGKVHKVVMHTPLRWLRYLP